MNYELLGLLLFDLIFVFSKFHTSRPVLQPVGRDVRNLTFGTEKFCLLNIGIKH